MFFSKANKRVKKSPTTKRTSHSELSKPKKSGCTLSGFLREDSSGRKYYDRLTTQRDIDVTLDEYITYYAGEEDTVKSLGQVVQIYSALRHFSLQTIVVVRCFVQAHDLPASNKCRPKTTKEVLETTTVEEVQQENVIDTVTFNAGKSCTASDYWFTKRYAASTNSVTPWKLLSDDEKKKLDSLGPSEDTTQPKKESKKASTSTSKSKPMFSNSNLTRSSLTASPPARKYAPKTFSVSPVRSRKKKATTRKPLSPSKKAKSSVTQRSLTPPQGGKRKLLPKTPPRGASDLTQDNSPPESPTPKKSKHVDLEAAVSNLCFGSTQMELSDFDDDFDDFNTPSRGAKPTKKSTAKQGKAKGRGINIVKPKRPLFSDSEDDEDEKPSGKLTYDDSDDDLDQIGISQSQKSAKVPKRSIAVSLTSGKAKLDALKKQQEKKKKNKTEKQEKTKTTKAEGSPKSPKKKSTKESPKTSPATKKESKRQNNKQKKTGGTDKKTDSTKKRKPVEVAEPDSDDDNFDSQKRPTRTKDKEPVKATESPKKRTVKQSPKKTPKASPAAKEKKQPKGSKQKEGAKVKTESPKKRKRTEVEKENSEDDNFDSRKQPGRKAKKRT